MKKIEEKLVKKFEEMSNWALAAGFANFPQNKKGRDWFVAFMKWKNDVNQLITEWNNEGFVNQSTKWFLFLGYVPRTGKNIFVCSCVLYHLIKRINKDVSILIFNDGSLVGKTNSLNKYNICLNAHMDVVDLSDNNNEIKYGVFGKEPNVSLESSWDGKELFINKHNFNTVLGADDGKGIISILSLLESAKRGKIQPSITFLLTAIEESPFGYSSRNFVKNQYNYNLIFPKNKINTMFLNFDSYSGRECDLYVENNQKKYWVKKHEENIIKLHEQYLKENNWSSTQDKCWINPPSDALILKNGYIEKNKENILFISLASDSINPHSNSENINLLELDKFNKWLCKEINNF